MKILRYLVCIIALLALRLHPVKAQAPDVYDLRKGKNLGDGLKTKWGEKNWRITIVKNQISSFIKKSYTLTCQCDVLPDKGCQALLRPYMVSRVSGSPPPPPGGIRMETDSPESFYKAYRYIVTLKRCEIDIHPEIDDKETNGKKDEERCLTVSCGDLSFDLCTSDSRGLTFKAGIVEFSVPIK